MVKLVLVVLVVLVVLDGAPSGLLVRVAAVAIVECEGSIGAAEAAPLPSRSGGFISMIDNMSKVRGSVNMFSHAAYK